MALTKTDFGNCLADTAKWLRKSPNEHTTLAYARDDHDVACAVDHHGAIKWCAMGKFVALMKKLGADTNYEMFDAMVEIGIDKHDAICFVNSVIGANDESDFDGAATIIEQFVAKHFHG